MEHYIPEFTFALIRISLGVLFFFQAYDKIFRIGLTNIAKQIEADVENKGIPAGLVKLSVYGTSLIEFIGGALLITGLFTIPVLFVTGFHLILVMATFGYLQGVWDMKHVFPRLILLILLLLIPQAWNDWSLDGLF